MWPHYNTNNNQQRHQHQNEYERRNTNAPSDPLSALAAYTLDASANATAFATASSVNNHPSPPPPDYYYHSSSSPNNQLQQHYHRDDPYYAQQRQQRQQSWDHGHYPQQHQYEYNQEESSEEEEEQDDELANINQNFQQQYESEEEESDQEVSPQKNSYSTPPTKANGMSALEYECISTLLEQFCKVPLLSEFSRPVSILHPEVSSVRALFQIYTNVCFEVNVSLFQSSQTSHGSIKSMPPL